MVRPTKLSEAEAFAQNHPDPQLLVWQPKLKSGQAAACVRALSHMGATAEVLEVLATYNSESRASVVKELVRAALGFPDKEAYAQRVLSGSTLKKFDLTAVAGKPNDLRLVGAMKALQELKFGPWEPTSQLACLAHLASLRRLTVDRVKVATLRGLEHLTELRELTMYWCDDVEDLDPISALTQLTLLRLYALSSITDARPLGALHETLSHLALAGGRRLSTVDGLETLTGLKTLTLRALGGLQDISALESMAELEHLELSNAASLADIHPLASLSSLISLELTYVRALKDISPLRALTSLQALELTYSSAEDIAPLEALTSLRTLNLSGGETQDYTALAALTQLRKLNLSGQHLKSLEMLSGAKSLEVLTLINCPNLTDLDALRDLPRLRHVTVWKQHGHHHHPVFAARGEEIILTVY